MNASEVPAAPDAAADGADSLSKPDTPATFATGVTPVAAIVISAMPEEMAPMRKLLQAENWRSQAVASPIGNLTICEQSNAAEIADAKQAESAPSAANTCEGTVNLLLAVTGIGFAATASCLGWLLAHYAPAAIISIGSAGGLAATAQVREVILGVSYRHGGADGTAFGYVRGQVPGQPEFFAADPALLAAASVAALDEPTLDEVIIRTGEMLSADTFVTAANVGDMRAAFPAAYSTDMESYAAAHVAHQFGVPFISIRAISDLCAPPAEQAQQFHAELAEVAELSARTALATLQNLQHL